MSNIYLQAAGLGLIAGMRSMSAPAFTSHHFAYTPGSGSMPARPLAQTPLRGFGLPATASILALMALGEITVDKLPGVPNRTVPGSVVFRALSGGLCGAAAFLAAGGPAGRGAAVGAAAAVASTYATFFLRREAGRASKIPDPLVAAAEDALVLGLGRGVFAAA